MSILKHILILYAQFILSAACIGQNQNSNRQRIDSLQKILPSLRDYAKIDCINSLFRSYYWILNDSFKQYVDPALKESFKLNYAHGIAEAENNKAILELRQRNLAAAEKLCRESLKWYERSSNKTTIGGTYLALGYVLYNQGLFDESILYLEKSYESSKKAGDEIRMFLSLEQIGSSYMERGNYEKAFPLFKEALQLILKLNNDFWIVVHLERLGELYRRIEDYSTALSYYKMAHLRVNSRSTFDYYGFAELYSLNQQYDSASYYYSFLDTAKRMDARLQISLSEFFSLQKQYDKALKHALRALPYITKSNERLLEMRALLDIAKNYSATQNDDSALHYATAGLKLASQTGGREFMMDGYNILYSIYDHRHRTDSAYFYYRQYITMRDLILSDQIKGRLASYSYEQRIELLNKEKEIQEANLQKASLLKNIFIAGILILFLLAAIVFRIIALKRKNEKLRLEHELDLKQIENDMTKASLQQQATELEMQALRAQMNPHFIFNSLNSINRFILQNNRVQASEYLTKFSRLVRLILQNSQSALISLDSELESLELYLELEALRFDYRFAYKISIARDLDVSALKVPPLIIQPYAENAIWHGLMQKEEKGQLDIELSQEGGHLVIKIGDNGIGRKQSAALSTKSATLHKSMGLRITADRIAIMQNSNGMDSPVKIIDMVNPDGSAAGTEVIIKIPSTY
jgi:tetratricopeptide (TPR) repeat protein